MLYIDKQDYIDKVKACWLGKNIGGTMGAPFEGRTEMQNITGFTTAKGEPLPNDDLDLQLVWLLALEHYGPWNFGADKLADFWLRFITPHWNEYGVCKGNLKNGLLPPLSGEYNNEHWKRSNGAWIRAEIWACLSAGIPEFAVKFAYADACVDHGLSEGTYAEIFIATLESACFTSNDLRKNIEKAFTFIPENCRVARAVKLAINCFDKKLDFVKARETIVEDSKDIGMFQAPQNIAFVVLGLLYGEGDFKKSMCLAINCGDDTDCTGATIGSIMGIMGGTKCVPTEWIEYIGDEIKTCCIGHCTNGVVPKTCTELTNRVVTFMPTFVRSYGLTVEFSDKYDFSSLDRGGPDRDYFVQNEVYCLKGLFNRSNYSVDVPSLGFASCVIDYGKEPIVKENDTFTFKLKFTPKIYEYLHIRLKLILPEGWTAEYDRSVMLRYALYYKEEQPEFYKNEEINVTVHTSDNISAINRIIAVCEVEGKPNVATFPITLIS